MCCTPTNPLFGVSAIYTFTENDKFLWLILLLTVEYGITRFLYFAFNPLNVILIFILFLKQSRMYFILQTPTDCTYV